jgi:hypothetical protein
MIQQLNSVDQYCCLFHKKHQVTTEFSDSQSAKVWCVYMSQLDSWQPARGGAAACGGGGVRCHTYCPVRTGGRSTFSASSRLHKRFSQSTRSKNPPSGYSEHFWVPYSPLPKALGCGTAGGKAAAAGGASHARTHTSTPHTRNWLMLAPLVQLAA